MDLPEGMRGRLVHPSPGNAAQRRSWLQARKQGLGASDLATVLHMSPFRDQTPLRLWLDKTSEAVDESDLERMRWGRRFERPIVDEFRVRHARELGITVAPSPGLLAHEEHPWLLATLDRVALWRGTREAAGPIEVKTAYWVQRRQWVESGVPDHVYIQVQGQLAVTGLPRAWVVVVFGGNEMPEPFLVERDELVIGQILELCGQWWKRYVVARVPPPIDDVTDLPRLPEVWPGVKGEKYDLPEGLARRLLLRGRISRRISQLEKARDRIDLAAKAAMQDASVAVWQGEALATWSRFPRRSFDLERFKRDHPALAKRYTSSTTSQRFTVHTTTEENQP